MKKRVTKPRPAKKVVSRRPRFNKQMLLNRVPYQITLRPKIPASIRSEEAVSKFFWRNFHFEFDTEPTSDNYEDIFYNSDLRSHMGLVLDSFDGYTLVLYPKYYVGDISDKNNVWTKYWTKLIKNSEIEDVVW